MPPKFFITHSWKDIEFARRLFKDLKAHGVEGWMDDSTVRGGQRLAEEINRGLEGCECYLPILSPAALESPWCWEEINAAIALTNRRGRKINGREIKLNIIPIIAEQCEMPALLSARLYFDFVGRYDDALKELLGKGFGVAIQVTPSRSVHPAPIVPVDAPPVKSEKVVAPTSVPPVSPSFAPADLETLYLEALEAFHLEKWQPAAEGFRKVVALESNYEDAAAKLKLSERALHEAELSTLYDDATKAIEANDWRAAIEHLEKLVALDAEYKDTAARLASAKNMLRASDLYLQACEAFDAKHFSDAVRDFEALLTLAPNYADAATKLAEAKRWAQLPDLYRRALKAIDAKQWQDAKTLLEQVQSVDANYRESKMLLRRAAEEWRKATLAELYNRAQKAIDAKQWEEAQALLEQLRGIDADYRESGELLAAVQKEFVPRKFVNPTDGKEMLLVPAGEFVMGDGATDAPQHKVYLDSFYISRYPVTNAEYKKFVDATKHAPPQHWSNGKIPAGLENHPVVNVTWQDAVAYCEWAKVRLPTEAEWEKAASWDDTKKAKRVYPWGDNFDASKCNSSESQIGTTTPVGKYSPAGDSPYGVADMAGNVWEWCADWYVEDYYQNSPEKNPKGPESATTRVLRGGSFSYNELNVRCAVRNSSLPSYWGGNYGFRVVGVASDASAL